MGLSRLIKSKDCAGGEYYATRKRPLIKKEETKRSGNVELTIARQVDPRQLDRLETEGFVSMRGGIASRVRHIGGKPPSLADYVRTGALIASSRECVDTGKRLIQLRAGDHPTFTITNFLKVSGFRYDAKGRIWEGEGDIRLKAEVVPKDKEREEKERALHEHHEAVARQRFEHFRDRIYWSDQCLSYRIASEDHQSVLKRMVPRVASDGGYNWPDPPQLVKLPFSGFWWR